MAHEKRKDNVAKLMKQLKNKNIKVDVSWDDRGDIWYNHDKSWRMTNDIDRYEYHTIIQDDAVLCDNFLDNIYKELAKGYDVYNWYIGTARPLQEYANKGE